MQATQKIMNATAFFFFVKRHFTSVGQGRVFFGIYTGTLIA